MSNKYMALDTETYHGKAFLLSNSKQVWPINCFADFIKVLVSLDTKKFVFYNLDYDVSALVKHLPKKIAGQVFLDRWVDGPRYKLRYIPGKAFSVVYKGCKYQCFDLFPFFQCSLNDASKKYLGKEKHKLSEELIKNLNPSSYLEYKAAIDGYAIQDSALLQELCDIFVQSLQSTGLKVSGLYSPGFLAKCYMKQRKITRAPVPVEIEPLLKEIFFGGRIEVVKRGSFSRVCIYDLKSAYPWAMRSLPDFSKALVKVSNEIESPLFLAEVEFEDNYKNVAPIAVKCKGLVMYPNLSGRKWITSDEFYILDQPKTRRIVNIFAKETYPYRDLIDELFSMRSLSGMEGLVYKLIINSMYGIHAEKRVSYRRTDIDSVYKTLSKERCRAGFETFLYKASLHCPNVWKFWDKSCKCEWCNAVRSASRRVSKIQVERILEFEGNFWTRYKKSGAMSNRLIASFITAKVRAKVYKAALANGSNFVGAFTDSVITIGEGLGFEGTPGTIGSWDKKYDGPLIMVGSGVYETNDETKFRGFRIKRTEKNPFPLRSMLSNMAGVTEKKIPQNSRTSFGLAVRSGFDRYTEFNVISEVEKTLDINFDSKRYWNRPFRDGPDALEQTIDSTPLSLVLKGGRNEQERVYDRLPLWT